ncbi:MAG: hypothetical protein GY795_29425, partial [Desulfobacterales bacterium]|nr:hypothetical protein [Desulfobacterales bacterium]
MNRKQQIITENNRLLRSEDGNVGWDLQLTDVADKVISKNKYTAVIPGKIKKSL